MIKISVQSIRYSFNAVSVIVLLYLSYIYGFKIFDYALICAISWTIPAMIMKMFDNYSLQIGSGNYNNTLKKQSAIHRPSKSQFNLPTFSLVKKSEEELKEEILTKLDNFVERENDY